MENLLSDNAVVSVVDIAGKYYALGETPFMQEINIATLDTTARVGTSINYIIINQLHHRQGGGINQLYHYQSITPPPGWGHHSIIALSIDYTTARVGASINYSVINRLHHRQGGGINQLYHYQSITPPPGWGHESIISLSIDYTTARVGASINYIIINQLHRRHGG